MTSSSIRSGTLVVMGSGETSPTMVTLHQQVIAAAGGSAATLVMLDTPAGFQENVAEIGDKAVAYFADSVGARVRVVPLRSAADGHADPALVAAVRAADWVFAGPGSPTYALRIWQATGVRDALVGVLEGDGAVVMASAASLTLGAWTVPVYEIYKVGEDPRWTEGLDLIGAVTGWRTAVIPHFDNNDGGGTHDTRYCYLGERRLTMLTDQLPAEAFVIGIDEHTALVIDPQARTLSVAGRGAVTIRAARGSLVLQTGSTVPFAEIEAHVGGPGTTAQPIDAAASASAEATPQAGSDLDQIRAGDGVDDDLASALLRVIALDASADSADDRRSVRRQLAVLAERAREAPDATAAVAPFVDALLALRASARADKRWADADAVRDALAAGGVDVQDTADGVTWTWRAVSTH